MSNQEKTVDLDKVLNGIPPEALLYTPFRLAVGCTNKSLEPRLKAVELDPEDMAYLQKFNFENGMDDSKFIAWKKSQKK